MAGAVAAFSIRSKTADDGVPAVLSPRDGYRLWAASYAGETAISQLDERLAAELTPPLEGLRLLDAGCGTGRRLRGCGAAFAVGVDLCPEMLDAGLGRACAEPGLQTLVADARRMPLPDRGFDVIWCRLVAGHLPDCAPLYAELARVADEGAWILVTDFHPAAAAAGHRRTFRSGGRTFEVEHHVHAVADHLAAAGAAGLRLVARSAGVIGEEVRSFYAAAGRLELYAAHQGLPVVLALAFRRGG